MKIEHKLSRFTNHEISGIEGTSKSIGVVWRQYRKWQGQGSGPAAREAAENEKVERSRKLRRGERT